MAGILEIRRGSTGITLNDGELYLNKGIQTVQIGSGSSVISLVPLNKLISGDILINGNVYANNLTGSGATGNSITSNVDIGGITAGQTFPPGTDITTIFEELLSPYVESVLSGLNLYFGAGIISNNPREVGETFSMNKYVYSSTTDSNTAYPINGTVTMVGSTNGQDAAGSFTGPSTLTPTVTINLSTITPTRNIPGNIVITVNAKKPDNSIFITPLVLSLPFRYKNILAASSVDVIDDSSAQTAYNAAVDFELTDTLSWTAICDAENNNSTKFTYIIYPSTYPDITQVSQNGTNVSTAFIKLTGTYNITNGNGISTTYKIYKSTQPGAYAAGTNLIIS